MTKVALDDLANLNNPTTAVNTINSNNQKIEQAFENTLSRDGASPNTMNADLDMNSNQILNLPFPTTGTEPIRLQDAHLFKGDTGPMGPPGGDIVNDLADDTDPTKGAAMVGYSGTTVKDTLDTLDQSVINLNQDVFNLGQDVIALDGDVGLLETDVLTLQNFNIQRYGSQYDIREFGITPNNSTPYTQANFDTLINGLVSLGKYSVYVPEGNYNLGETIYINRGITFNGVHKSHTVFRCLHLGTGFVFTGQFGTGGGLKKLSVAFDTGGSTSVAYIQAIASVAGYSPDFLELEDLNLTGFNNSLCQYGVIFDGNARNGSAPNLLHGIRALRMARTDIFNTTVTSLDLRKTRGILIDSVSIYPASGTARNIVLSSNSSNPSELTSGIFITNSGLGDFSASNAVSILAQNSDLSNVVIASSVASSVIGTAFGTISNSGSSVRVFSYNPALDSYN